MTNYYGLELLWKSESEIRERWIFMIINHNLLPKQKSRRLGLNVSIDLFLLAEELYRELFRIGIIDRIKTIPQLGVIKVNRKLSKVRFDYMALQLYFHQIIKKNVKNHLRFSYNNYMKTDDFLPDIDIQIPQKEVSIADIIQILVIVYNIGHFYNTFTASRAVTMLLEYNSVFADHIKSCIDNNRFKSACDEIFSACDYHRMHLLNSFMVLEHCDPSIKSVQIAKEIIYAYINEMDLSEKSKLHYVFDLFRTVRNVAYSAYDLQIANTPFTLDIWNEEAISNFFRELLSEFNNKESAINLVSSFQKLLDDTVYNENNNAICYYQISNKIFRKALSECGSSWENYYDIFWLNRNSVFNERYRQNRDYVCDGILKLTFEKDERHIAKKLFHALEHLNCTRVGYYDRNSGRMTIVVSIKKSSNGKSKIAFRVLKVTISHLRRISGIQEHDVRYLLVAKFFLRYLFNENQIILKSAMDNKKCLLCIKGKTRRVIVLQKMIDNDSCNEDTNHEMEFVISHLQENPSNEVTIIIPCSTLVLNKSEGRKLAEFDGIIIYPNRATNQIVLLEAKNTAEKPIYGKKCLEEKLKKLHIEYEKDSIIIDGYDAYFEISL